MKKRNILVTIVIIVTVAISVNYALFNSYLVGQVKQIENVTSRSYNNDDQNYFDPTIYRSYYDEFTSQSNNSWYDVAGTWSLDDMGLRGGTFDNTTSSVDNILISPVASRTLTNITTTFTVNDLNATETNSVSIVYSAIDPKNYRQAGINIHRDNIYARFADINNGSLTSPHPWPGVNTSMKFTPGSLFNMSLSIQNNSQSLYINGSEFPYEGNNTSVDGYVGLKYGKIKDINFHNFRVDNMNNPDT